MTEKRFKLFVGKNYGVQTVDGEVIFESITSIIEADVLVNLLNDLSDEIKLKEENEQLKEEIKDLKFENEKKYRKIKQLEQMLQDVER